MRQSKEDLHETCFHAQLHAKVLKLLEVFLSLFCLMTVGFLQQNMSRDKNSFCELCYVVFSSHVVAKSHYEGKIHAKNLRRRSLLMPGK